LRLSQLSGHCLHGLHFIHEVFVELEFGQISQSEVHFQEFDIEEFVGLLVHAHEIDLSRAFSASLGLHGLDSFEHHFGHIHHIPLLLAAEYLGHEYAALLEEPLADAQTVYTEFCLLVRLGGERTAHVG